MKFSSGKEHLKTGFAWAATKKRRSMQEQRLLKEREEKGAFSLLTLKN